VDLRLEVATLTERAAHVADLRAIIATLQAQAPKPKAPALRRGSVQQEKSGDSA